MIREMLKSEGTVFRQIIQRHCDFYVKLRVCNNDRWFKYYVNFNTFLVGKMSVSLRHAIAVPIESPLSNHQSAELTCTPIPYS